MSKIYKGEEEQIEYELNFIIEKFYNALKQKEDIKEEIEKNKFAKFNIDTSHFRATIKIKKEE